MNKDINWPIKVDSDTFTSLEDFLKDSEELLTRGLELMKSKAHDYTDNKDNFWNFKETAAISGVTPAQVALVQVGHKVSRLVQLVGNGKEPMNEKIEDTIVDLINYLLILRGIIKENTK